MSRDDDFEGSDDKAFFEHFEPVWNSVRRTLTSRWVWLYTVSFVGVIVLSASMGGLVLGAYAAVQPTYGLCGHPTIDVSSAEDTETLIEGTDAPNFTRLTYDDLSGEERDAFRKALRVPNENAELDGSSRHIEDFENGTVVSYRGTDHYVVTETMDNCVPMGTHSIPLGAAGLVVGGALFVSPSLWRRLTGSE